MLLTGATGYIGRALLPALLKCGLKVRTMGRNLQDDVYLDLLSCLEFPKNFSGTIFSGVSQVVHCAGLAHREASLNLFEQINTQATLSLARHASEAGVRRFIFLSSLNIIPSEADDPTMDAMLYPLPIDPYELSKWQTEKQLSEFCDGVEMSLIIIRPAAVYDIELAANLAKLKRLLRYWPCRLPRKGKRCLVARPDLVALICSLAETAFPHQMKIVVATDGETYDSYRIGEILTNCRLRLSVPDEFYRFAARFLDYTLFGPWGDSWQTLIRDHWCAASPEVEDWSPKWKLETRLKKQL